MTKNFYLIGYDLRIPRHEDALAAGIQACATKHSKIAWGPWFLQSEQSPTQIRDTLRDRITEADTHEVFNDKLLVVPLGESPAVVVRGSADGITSFKKTMKLFKPEPAPPATSAEPEARNQFKASAGETDKPEVGRILAITYTLRGATRQLNRELRRAIWRSFPDCTKPVRALWFVRCNKPPTQVANELSRIFKSEDRFGLLVVELKRIGLATPGRLRRDSFWLWEHGISSEHTLLEAATPRTELAA